MNIHEYQAKLILKQFGVPIPNGDVAFTAEQAVDVANKIDSKTWVIKAQVHAGGRGKGGGIKVVEHIKDVYDSAKKIIGMNLVTPQTDSKGKKVSKVYVEQGAKIKSEFYLSFLVDRQTCRITILSSTEGGMDIEEVASKFPEKIFSVSVDPTVGVQPYHSRAVAFSLGLEGSQIKKFTMLISSCYRAFVEKDFSLLEINPLVVLEDDSLIVLDAKINFDDNALFRQDDITKLRDKSEEDPVELEASEYDLNYIKLDGSIGCMVNGAGLAMATMDIIKLYGGEPANFLDVGGGATKEKVTEAFKIILSDKNVKGVLVNIFGGIMRCDVIAEGIIAAALEVSIKVPLVVRLEGTNVELGKEILEKSGLEILSAGNLEEAAKKIVNSVGKLSQ